MKIIIGVIIFLISFNANALTFKQMMKALEIAIVKNYNSINTLIVGHNTLEKGLNKVTGELSPLITESKIDHDRVISVSREVEVNRLHVEDLKTSIIPLENKVAQLSSLKDDMEGLEILEGAVRDMGEDVSEVTQNLQSWPESKIPRTAEIEDVSGVLTLRRCPNTLEFVWGSCTYAAGDRGPAGGIVVIVTDDGKNGIEISEELPPAEYGCDRKKVKVPSKWGRKKTNLEKTELVASSEQCGGKTLAKKSLDYAINGKDDWYLPGVNELAYIYDNLDELGLNMEGVYWAVEVSRYDPRRLFASAFNFHRGHFVDKERAIEQNVRYIRRF